MIIFIAHFSANTPSFACSLNPPQRHTNNHPITLLKKWGRGGTVHLGEGGPGTPPLPLKKIPSNNPSIQGVTTTPPHPKYQNNNMTNTQMNLILLNSHITQTRKERLSKLYDFIYKIKS